MNPEETFSTKLTEPLDLNLARSYLPGASRIVDILIILFLLLLTAGLYLVWRHFFLS